jgi:hypothetical protein
MKTPLLLLALIFGYMAPTYPQPSRHLEMDSTSEHFRTKKNDDFGRYQFHNFKNYQFDKFTGFLSTRYNFNLLPEGPAQGNSPMKYSRWNNMPCFHPKSGDNMPCLKPTDTFPMRIFNPENVIWGILW